MTIRSDILIIGGGVIGCAVARKISQSGKSVTLIERGEPNREASWAAAGALIARALSEEKDPLLELKIRSLRMFETLCSRLTEETGIDTGFRKTGGIDFLLEEQEIRDADRFLTWQSVHGIPAEKITPEELHKMEPRLNPEIRQGVYFPGFTQVRTPWFTRALLISAIRCGTRVETHTEMREFLLEGDRVIGVRTDRDECFADTTILTAGPWSPFLARLVGKELPGVPVKGQIILLQDRSRPVKHIVHHGKTYITPRDEGRLVVGSTEEWVGFQRQNTVGGIAALLQGAKSFYPCLESASLEAVWYGFRPLTVDGRPFLGPIDGLQGFLCATGHYRSGIILAPLTAEILADLVEGREPAVDLSPFSPDRVASMESIDLSPRTDFH